jgi:glycosyltransferase involved in cell wall biosynthesis
VIHGTRSRPRRRPAGVTACRRVSRLLSITFWISVGGLVWAHAGYGLLLDVLRRRRAGPSIPAAPGDPLPSVSLIVAAHREESVIAAKVADALALDWPRDRLQVIVAVDGGADPAVADATVGRARAAGADLVLELPRGGKIRAQDAAVREARGDLLAFSDANSRWRPDALRRLVAAFADPQVGYACGQVTFVNEAGTNQEGLYWRYEMWLRERESGLASVTGGNGAIYAVRREAYMEVDPIMGHDLSFPFRMVKRGWRAVYAPQARAEEKMVPSIEGEWVRKRRMMSHAWPIVLRGGMLNFRGYPPLYAVMILSHRVLRYASPLLHALALITGVALVRRGLVYRAAVGAQAALLAAAAAAGRWRRRPLLVARYYVLTTASLAAGLHDWLRHGTPAGWDAPEGTR